MHAEKIRLVPPRDETVVEFAETGGDEALIGPGWLAQVRAGDQAAARALVERVRPVVLRIVRARKPRRLAEEDLTQEVFMKMFARLDQYAGEAPFAPRVGGVEEDDGYLVSFITDENSGTSECILIDAKDLAAGPVCRIALPHKISSGTHSCWTERRMLGPTV